MTLDDRVAPLVSVVIPTRNRHSALAAQAVPVAMAALLRTDVVQRHPIPDAAEPAYDIWLHYALAGEGRPYWYSPRRLTQWRFHETGGTSVGSPEWYRGAAFTWEAVCADLRFRAIQPAAPRLFRLMLAASRR